MKAATFIYELFKKFPLLLLSNIVLVLIMSLLNACSLLAICPVVDLFLHPDREGISSLTAKAVDIMGRLGLPVTLGTFLVILVAFIVLAGLFHICSIYAVLKAKYAVERDIMIGAFEDFFNARWQFFSSSRQGTLLNTFTREREIVGNSFGTMAFFFASIIELVFCLAVPIYISWKVTAISLISALLFAVPFLFLGGLCYRLGLLNTSTANHLTSVIHENFNLAKVVLGFGNQWKNRDNLRSAYNAHSRVAIWAQTLGKAMTILYNPFGVIMVVIALIAARRIRIPLAEIMVLLLAMRQVAALIGTLVTQKNSLEIFLPSYEQIKRLRQQAKDLRQVSGTRQFDGFTHGLYIKDLSFAYHGHKEVLVGIDICIPKGKMVAFVGESGVGKSTLIDIIMGFHKPIAGQIMLDDVPLHDFDIQSYRTGIGYVPQDSVLFNMSIRENLLWSCESSTDAEMINACSQANADEFINRLPQGYDTVVGDRGIRLSGGQIQRVALARAILRKPSLLILDEATSSLDTHSERLIQQAIENIAKETTVIVIAHRLSTIINADYIYVLVDGRVVEEGTYSWLVARDSHFNRMIKLQELEAATK